VSAWRNCWETKESTSVCLIPSYAQSTQHQRYELDPVWAADECCLSTLKIASCKAINHLQVFEPHQGMESPCKKRIATLVAVTAAGQYIHAFDSCPKVQRHMQYQQTRRDGRPTMIPRSANTACNSSNSRAPLLFLSYCSCQAGHQPFTLLTASTLYMRRNLSAQIMHCMC